MQYLDRYAALLESQTRSVRETVGTTVAYRALLKPPARAAWQALLLALAEAPKPSNKNEELALWINAYNILAIEMVRSHYPVESIRDVGSFFNPVWKRDAGIVAGRAVTLHEIEHEILRPIGDPRIHAAIVCASTSCPSLAREPFRTDHIDAQLDAAVERWLASPTKGLRVDRPSRRIFVSQIFKWFEDDFDALGGVRATLLRFGPASERAWLEAQGADATLAYFPYDWTVNALR